jgi:glycosyltransferase involved in cell wall biosynthesis
MPEVSVILPTMDRWPLLSRALASVLAQEDVDLEVIVVDDGSSDGTPTRLGGIDDPRLHVVAHEANRGVAHARNRGIADARGEWVAFLDDDDFWAPTCLREHLRSIADAGAGWGYGAAISVGPDRPSRVMMPAPPEELEMGLLQHNLVGPPSTATVRRDVLQKVGGFDERLSVIADWDLWVRLSRCAPAALCEDPLVAYWDHPDGMHRQSRAQLGDEIEVLGEKYARLMPTRERFGVRTAARLTVAADRLAGRRLTAAFAYLRIGASERSRIDLLRGVALLGGERAVSRLKTAARPEAPQPDWLTAVIGAPTEQDTAEGRAISASLEAV